jgi:protein ImuB
VAVVAKDRPQGLILWVNEKARQAGVLPGLRYAAALSLTPTLRAGEVPAAEIEKEIAALTKRLMRFTPEVEPSAGEPGIFWFSVSGLRSLYPSLEEWARAVRADLEAQNFCADIVVGFTRFGTYAVAKVKKGITVFDDLSEERRAAHKVSLDRLDLDPDLRDTLFKLGIKTVGAFLSLPPGGLYERFGPEAYRLHRLASGDLWAPLQPHVAVEPVRQRHLLDDPENDTNRLLFLIKRLLHPMTTTLAARSETLAALWLFFLTERGDWIKEQIRPAAPTLDSAQVLDLIRLRLESMKFSAGVTEIELTAEGYPATSEQLRFFTEKPGRDLDAANRALARLRAEFGDEAVVRAKLTDGHLPEARFTWEPLTRVRLPKNDLNGAQRLNGLNGLNLSAPNMLVRRIFAKPVPLTSGTQDDSSLRARATIRQAHGPEQQSRRTSTNHARSLGPKYGAIEKLSGPYIFSGGWWNREIRREYYFAETRKGDLLWVYYDRVRRKWFLQGAVE